jgi:hypothetical protein
MSCIEYSHEFEGSVLVRFERSTLPEHEGTRTIVLRVLKIITPVKCVIPDYDGYLCCPKEGELYSRLHRVTKKFPSPLNLEQQVWSVNIDKSKNSLITTGLRLLWDT